MQSRGPHEGGVDSESMSPRKIASIVARMHDDLRPPSCDEGFDEVLCASSEEAVKEALSRIWNLADRDGVDDDVDPEVP